VRLPTLVTGDEGAWSAAVFLLRECICLAHARHVDHVEGHLNLKEVTGSTFQPHRVQDVADGRVELREHSKHVRNRHT
jgi:hypothetical protein